MTWLVVSLHDVAPATAVACHEWVDDIDRIGVPLSLLVIPGRWRGASLADDLALVRWLHRRGDRRDEIVQHGWCHAGVDGGPRWRRAVGSVVARGCAEFAALDELDAARRLERGGEVLDRLGFLVDGFTPPGWLASPGAVRALRRLGYRYTTTHTGIRDLHRDVTVRAPALAHRPGGIGERVGAEVLERASRHEIAAGRPIRIALHPDDRTRPALVAATLRAITAALDLGARARTYRDVLTAAAAV
jgi:predicted deacetylase